MFKYKSNSNAVVESVQGTTKCSFSRHHTCVCLQCIERYVRLLTDLTVVAKAGHEGPLVAAKTAFLNSFIDCQEKLLEIFEKVQAFLVCSVKFCVVFIIIYYFSVSLLAKTLF